MGITNFIPAILSIIQNVFGVLADEKKNELMIKLEEVKASIELDTAQAAVNQVQAANPSIFVSGARPMIMWGLGSIVVLYALGVTVINFLIAFHFHVAPMPPMDPFVRDIIMGLLGLGHITRTFEKWAGIQNKH